MSDYGPRARIKLGDKIRVMCRDLKYNYDRTGIVVHVIEAEKMPTVEEMRYYYPTWPIRSEPTKPHISQKALKVDRYVIEITPGHYAIFPESYRLALYKIIVVEESI